MSVSDFELKSMVHMAAEKYAERVSSNIDFGTYTKKRKAEEQIRQAFVKGCEFIINNCKIDKS